MRGPRRDGASPRDPRLSGLEIWLTGTPAELDAATAALTAAGHRLAQRGTRRPLTGTDAGRHRLYLRVSVATTARRSGQAPDLSGAALLDLNAARTQRHIA
ncbi:hypothetical protein [Verrucosispora sp. NA02020]|uniref:hypothetical protein n=1 Tax=Verrucosispora sp. NA02020 TaxID=2742132 RepID=UPI0015903842|nr:hypothetical protein [Verrucosispora sp. NA02020]QKW12389.1 hypothetical protein HUT12_05995 [Verrucosispora sp. NA02020]